MRRSLSRTSGAVLLAALALAHTQARASTNGNIAGIITDQVTGKGMAGVTVTVSGPALQGAIGQDDIAWSGSSGKQRHCSGHSDVGVLPACQSHVDAIGHSQQESGRTQDPANRRCRPFP